MKKLIFTTIIILLGWNCSAQMFGHSIEITSGVTQDGFGVYGGYNYFLSETSFLQWTGGASFSEQEERLSTVSFDIYTLRMQYFKEVYSTRRAGFSIYLGGGLLAGYEDVSVSTNVNNRGFSSLQESQFIFGPMVSAELDMFISRKSSIALIVNQQWQINSDVGQFIPYAGLGYKYNLN